MTTTTKEECFICTNEILYGVKSTKCTDNHTICISCFKEYHKYKCIFCRQRMRTVQITYKNKVVAITPTQNLINTECIYTMKQKNKKLFVIDYTPIMYNILYICIVIVSIFFMNILVLIGFRTPRYILNCNDIIQGHCVYTDISIIISVYKIVTAILVTSLNLLLVDKISECFKRYHRLTPIKLKNKLLMLSSR